MSATTIKSQSPALAQLRQTRWSATTARSLLAAHTASGETVTVVSLLSTARAAPSATVLVPVLVAQSTPRVGPRAQGRAAVHPRSCGSSCGGS